jgi:shikimate dehydrogenase
MKVYAVIGYPLTHSFSKKYFTEKFQREGIKDCIYEAYPISSIGGLKELLEKHPNIRGLNVTLPYKQQVLPHLYSTEDIPAGLGACNCIKLEGEKLFGFNTDVIAFEQSLRPLLKSHHTNALILGNGGAAEAVKFVLKKLSIGYKIVSRKIHEDSDLTYTDLNEAILKEHPLIINTTPLGTFPNVNEYSGIPYLFLTSQHLLFDLVYNPAKTLFLQKGEEQGAAIKNGYEMLVLQAEESWKIWNED